MPDGRDDRDGRGGNRSNDRLVAEREEILEAAAAAREHDDVDLGMTRQVCERGDDRGGGALALDSRLDSTTFVAGKRAPIVETRSPRAAASAPVRMPTARGTRGRRALPVCGEEPFPSERALQLLEAEEVSAQADPLDRGRAKRKLGLLLEQLRPPRDVHRLALLETELEAVVDPPRDRDRERRTGLRVLESQEDVRPGRLCRSSVTSPSTQIGRQPPEVHPDPTVEGRHREDLPIAVEDVLDLRHVARLTAARRALRSGPS